MCLPLSSLVYYLPVRTKPTIVKHLSGALLKGRPLSLFIFSRRPLGRFPNNSPRLGSGENEGQSKHISLLRQT
jgi:hypothetical protein